MRQISKFISIILFFSICFFGVCSFAANDVVIDIKSVDPIELSTDGTVNISFELSNHTEKELSAISVSLGEVVFDFSGNVAIPASGSAILPIALPLNVSQLDTPLVFTFKWMADGEPYYGTAETTVARTVDPTISLTRSLSAKHARTGQQITVTYVMKNPTKFDMTEVTLIDEQISDEPIRNNDVLQANGSFSIDYPFIMGTKDVVSKPIVTYVVNEKTKSFSNVKAATVVYSDIAVDISAEKKTTGVNGTEFEITLKNTGASDVFGLLVSDSDGNPVTAEPIDLKAGQDANISYIVPPLTSNQPKQITFTFSGTDTFGDALEPGSTKVFLINPFFDDSQFSVYLTAEVMTRPAPGTNSAEIKLSIENMSLLPLSNVVISEPSLGTVATLDSLPSGQTDLIQWISFDPDADLEFFIEGRDDSGSNHQLGSVMLSKEILIPESTPGPVDEACTDEGAYDIVSPSIWSSFVFRILVIIGAVLILSCAVLVALRVLDVGKVEVDDDEIDGIFDAGSDGNMDTFDEYELDSSENNRVEKNLYPEGISRNSVAPISEGYAPKHIQLKKQPAKKKRQKQETRRIG